ncbi:MAG: DUF1127 domain-containing protein [Alphaproteobacteria bacterium]
MNPILKTIRQWRSKSITQGQLARLSDRTLRDVGVSRFDIQRCR